MGRACDVHGGEHSLLVGKPDRKRPLKGSRRTLGDNNVRQAMYVRSNIEARSCKRSCSGTAIGITCYGCVLVLVALGTQCAMRMRLIVICGVPGSTVVLHIVS